MADTADPYEQESGVTAGKLAEILSHYPKDYPVCFGPHGHFTYYRVKDRTGCVQIEFNEAPDVDYQLTETHHFREHLRKIGLEPGGP